mgnify:CR=1 FL=1|jgi:hypothetical protein
MVEKTRVYMDPYREKYYAKVKDTKGSRRTEEVKEPTPKPSEDPMVDEAMKRKDYKFANALLSKERIPDPVMDKIKDTAKSFEEKDLGINKEEIVAKVFKEAKERGDI